MPVTGSLLLEKEYHCVRSIHIRSYSGPYFPAFGLNTEYLSVFSPNAEKYGPEKLRMQTIFTQCMMIIILVESSSFLVRNS